MTAPRNESSPPVVAYEPAFAQQRFAARLRLARWCGVAPISPLLIGLAGSILLHDRRWLVATIGLLIVAHGVVGFGLFVICMQYAVSRERLLSHLQFLREAGPALLLLIVNWPLFIAIVVVAWRWK